MILDLGIAEFWRFGIDVTWVVTLQGRGCACGLHLLDKLENPRSRVRHLSGNRNQSVHVRI